MFEINGALERREPEQARKAIRVVSGTIRPRPDPGRKRGSGIQQVVVGVVGFEPTTLTPQRSGSTTELHPVGREVTTPTSCDLRIPGQNLAVIG